MLSNVPWGQNSSMLTTTDFSHIAGGDVTCTTTLENSVMIYYKGKQITWPVWLSD